MTNLIVLAEKHPKCFKELTIFCDKNGYGEMFREELAAKYLYNIKDQWLRGEGVRSCNDFEWARTPERNNFWEYVYHGQVINSDSKTFYVEEYE